MGVAGVCLSRSENDRGAIFPHSRVGPRNGQSLTHCQDMLHKQVDFQRHVFVGDCIANISSFSTYHAYNGMNAKGLPKPTANLQNYDTFPPWRARQR
jgi:hypothetical protein